MWIAIALTGLGTYLHSQRRNATHTVYLTTLLSPIDESPHALASRLLYRFGSIGKIAQASDNELRQAAVSGERWVDAFLMVRRLMHDGMREELIRTRLGEDQNALFSYLSLTMKNLPEERMIAIFADAASYVIAEEIIAEGGDAHILITPRRILGRAMNLDARRIGAGAQSPIGMRRAKRTRYQEHAGAVPTGARTWDGNRGSPDHRGIAMLSA